MFEDAMKMVKNVDDITHVSHTEEQKEEMRFELSRKSARRLLSFLRERALPDDYFHQDFPKI